MLREKENFVVKYLLEFATLEERNQFMGKNPNNVCLYDESEIDANALFVDIREEDKAVITKSFDELEAYKKKIGKCISKSMLQEFSNFRQKIY